MMGPIRKWFNNPIFTQSRTRLNRGADTGSTERNAAEIENLSAKYDYQTQSAALQYSAGLLR